MNGQALALVGLAVAVPVALAFLIGAIRESKRVSR